ncbi:MAG: UDP-N-acetylglucosamine 1-carboxyvinyltransferase [Planctomycetota bacterium]
MPVLDKFIIEGGKKLKGDIKVSGAKNAVLPIIAATILCNSKCTIRGVPLLRDVNTMCEILSVLGMRVERTDNTITVEPEDEKKNVAPYELVNTMRASICVLGPLLAKRKQAKVSHPGGCTIGVRPIDLHIKGLLSLGAKIETRHGYIEATMKRPKGADIYLGGAYGSSVTGTENVMMAAVLAEGQTVIQDAACEPEVQDLAHFLNKCGARIEGIGSKILTIRGVKELHGADYRVIPDRIEAGTYLIISALSRGAVTVRNVKLRHLGALLHKLEEIGFELESGRDWCRVLPAKKIRSVDVVTQPYPGIPTDLQAQIMALLCFADGISVITEKIYPDRFMHVAELTRMGANLRKEGTSVIVQGVKKLYGAAVQASDLRAGAGLIIAALMAEGKTELLRVYHIDRGYEKIEKKLSMLGAKIERTAEEYPKRSGEEA